MVRGPGRGGYRPGSGNKWRKPIAVAGFYASPPDPPRCQRYMSSRRKLVLTSDEEDDEGIEDEVREVEEAPGQLVLSSVAKRIGGRGMQKGGRVILGNV